MAYNYYIQEFPEGSLDETLYLADLVVNTVVGPTVSGSNTMTAEIHPILLIPAHEVVATAIVGVQNLIDGFAQGFVLDLDSTIFGPLAIGGNEIVSTANATPKWRGIYNRFAEWLLPPRS